LKRILWLVAAALTASVLSACGGGSVTPSASSNQPMQSQSLQVSPSSPYIRTGPEGNVIHVYPLPQNRPAVQFATKNVTYHGGPVIHSSTAYAIFMRPTGTYMSPLYETAIEDFYDDIGGTAQYNILTQYTDTAGPILNQATFGAAWTDTAAYPSGFGSSNSGDKDLHTEVLKAVKTNGWPSGGMGPVYFIFTAQKAPDDSWAACAYHSAFSSNGHTYVYAIVPYQHDYGADGCGTKNNGTWPNDRDADETIDTMWHEYAEAVSDPASPGAWYNGGGSEIGDLCQTSYGPLASDGSDVTDGDSNFVTQMIWSNYGSKCVQTQASR
jgi:hypothetical protein